MKSLFKLVGKPVDFVTPGPGQKLRLSGRRLGMVLPSQPVEIELGKEILHVQKEFRLNKSSTPGPPDLIIFNPELDSEGICYSTRLKPGQTLHISSDQPDQEHLFRSPREAFRRNFYLEYHGSNLVFRNPVSELGTYITVLEHEVEQSPIAVRRRSCIDELASFHGGPLEAFQPDEALSLLQKVVSLLRNETFRQTDSSGNPGGLLKLPTHVTPVIIGDLHANIDNLLKILSENHFLHALKVRTAALLFLGDLAQPDSEPYEDMDGSVLIMDFLFKLKLKFPNGIFFLRGNHESFSAEVVKDLVPQGILWRRKLEQIRGEKYCDQMRQFYNLSPVVALSDDFIACHGGPPLSKIKADQLVNIRDFPELLHELVWNRIRQPGRPSGYTALDVRRLRKSLNLRKELPFLVSHTPYSDEGTLWCNVAGIRHHHVLYSANNDQLAIFTRVNGKMVPQVYSAEPLLEWVNSRAR